MADFVTLWLVVCIWLAVCEALTVWLALSVPMGTNTYVTPATNNPALMDPTAMSIKSPIATLNPKLSKV